VGCLYREPAQGVIYGFFGERVSKDCDSLPRFVHLRGSMPKTLMLFAWRGVTNPWASSALEQRIKRHLRVIEQIILLLAQSPSHPNAVTKLQISIRRRLVSRPSQETDGCGLALESTVVENTQRPSLIRCSDPPVLHLARRLPTL
jgi:hypothetical protein